MLHDPRRKRVDFKNKRFVDSGVWMGSDESGAESLLLSEDASAWGEDLIKSARDTNAAVGKGTENGSSLLRQQYQSITGQPCNAFRKVEELDEHRLAREVVNDCLEKGQDCVDLRLVIFP